MKKLLLALAVVGLLADPAWAGYALVEENYGHYKVVRSVHPTAKACMTALKTKMDDFRSIRDANGVVYQGIFFRAEIQEPDMAILYVAKDAPIVYGFSCQQD